jgi:DeoR family transcriptional regulator, carbon catabolite repression regulator
MKQAMLNVSQKKIALGNTEKPDSTYAFKVCDLQDIDVLITDIPGDDPKLDAYRNMGVKLV